MCGFVIVGSFKYQEYAPRFEERKMARNLIFIKRNDKFNNMAHNFYTKISAHIRYKLIFIKSIFSFSKGLLNYLPVVGFSKCSMLQVWKRFANLPKS